MAQSLACCLWVCRGCGDGRGAGSEWTDVAQALQHGPPTPCPFKEVKGPRVQVGGPQPAEEFAREVWGQVPVQLRGRRWRRWWAGRPPRPRRHHDYHHHHHHPYYFTHVSSMAFPALLSNPKRRAAAVEEGPGGWGGAARTPPQCRKGRSPFAVEPDSRRHEVAFRDLPPLLPHPSAHLTPRPPLRRHRRARTSKGQGPFDS